LLLGTGGAYTADGWDLPSCYIEVHGSCFNVRPNCTREDYELLLDNCDDAYDKAVAVPRPGYSATLSPQLKKYQSRQ
jgi:hypothetical protein